jgi:hypothetical protein
MAAILDGIENEHRRDREQTECREPIHVVSDLFDAAQACGYVGRP